MSTDAPRAAAQTTWRSPAAAPSARYAAGVALIVGGYYGATKVSEALQLMPGDVGVVWLATGVGVAVLHLGGWRWWPAVLLADLLSLNWAALPTGSALGETVANMVEISLAVVILQRLAGRKATMDRLTDVGAVLVAAVIGSAAGAIVATMSVWAGDVIDAPELDTFWRTWWLADAAGGLVVIPLALAWTHARRLAWRGRSAVEGALTLASVAVLTALGFSSDQPLTYIVLPALVWSALRFGPQGATLAVAVATAIAVGATSSGAGPFVEQDAAQSALNLQLYIAVTALTTLCLAAIVSERRRAALGLRESRRRIQAAADNERHRIQRDLHDGAQQRLVALIVKLELAAEQAREDPERGAMFMRELGSEAEEALEEVRALAGGVYPPLLADKGISAALQAAARHAPIRTTIHADGVGRYHVELESAVYFCCLEALQNAAKHASGASAVTITVADDGAFRFAVRDDGGGFPAGTAGSGRGLTNMRDRLAAVGGELRIESAPGEGTCVVGVIPLSPSGRPFTDVSMLAG